MFFFLVFSWVRISRASLELVIRQGYGGGGFPAWGIPGGATLQFTLECLKAGKVAFALRIY